ncbi:unnamed protein product, partial [Protopolystoma xenopodis]
PITVSKSYYHRQLQASKATTFSSGLNETPEGAHSPNLNFCTAEERTSCLAIGSSRALDISPLPIDTGSTCVLHSAPGNVTVCIAESQSVRCPPETKNTLDPDGMRHSVLDAGLVSLTHDDASPHQLPLPSSSSSASSAASSTSISPTIPSGGLL